MSNRTLIIAVVSILAAHLAVLALLLATGRPALLLGLNAVVAAGALVYVASRLRYVLVGPDWQMLALAGVELVVLALAAAAYAGVRFAPGVSYAAFSVHLLAAVMALAFVLLFRWPRLF